jgi:hypothetical protein
LAFELLTIGIVIGLLLITAWQEQYVDNNTFGSFANYRDLVLSGIGAGLGREAVLTLARGWGVALTS